MYLSRQLRTLSNNSYTNLYYWLYKRKNSNIYDFGIKNNLLIEKGHIDKLEFYDINHNYILSRKTDIGSYKIDNTIYNIMNPLENSILIKTYNIDLDKLNKTPEDLDNKIATFELREDILKETYFKYFK
jgi:hypothetical protein